MKVLVVPHHVSDSHILFLLSFVLSVTQFWV